MKFKTGQIVEAAFDIKQHLGSDKVVCPAGTRLVVIGESRNALHPVAVRKEDDLNWALAVSEGEIQHLNTP